MNEFTLLRAEYCRDYLVERGISADLANTSKKLQLVHVQTRRSYGSVWLRISSDSEVELIIYTDLDIQCSKISSAKYLDYASYTEALHALLDRAVEFCTAHCCKQIPPSTPHTFPISDRRLFWHPEDFGYKPQNTDAYWWSKPTTLLEDKLRLTLKNCRYKSSKFGNPERCFKVNHIQAILKAIMPIISEAKEKQ